MLSTYVTVHNVMYHELRLAVPHLSPNDNELTGVQTFEHLLWNAVYESPYWTKTQNLIKSIIVNLIGMK